MRLSTKGLVSVALGLLCLAEPALGQRRGGGARGGGGGFRGGGGGGGMRARSVSRPSVTSRPSIGGGGGGFNRPSNPIANRPSTPNIDRGNINRGNINSGNINRGNINTGDVNRGDWNNRNVNIDDVNVNGGWYDHDYGCCYGWGAAAAVGAAAVITSAAIGSTVYALPSSCTVVVVNGATYQQCGDTWYQPQFVGTETSYVVVSPPQ